MEHANLRTPGYFMLRLQTPPVLSHHEVLGLYGEFVGRYRDVFDFSVMKPDIHAQEGVPFNVNIIDVMEIPGCTLLFILREIEAAQNECNLTAVGEAMAHYDALVRNYDGARLADSLRMLSLRTDLPKVIENVRSRPMAPSCRSR